MYYLTTETTKRGILSVAVRMLLVAGALAAAGGCASEPLEGVQTVGKWYWTEPVTGASYYVYVPLSYDHSKPAPVIISCHGTVPYDVSNSHIETWKGYGEKDGCIVVCPDLVGTDGIFGDGPTSAMLEDERRILSILSSLSYRYNIDRANILLTGFSGGGFPTYFVGLRNPDVFTCIAPRNSNFNERNLDGWYPPQAKNLPIFVPWGSNDPGPIQAQAQNGVSYLRRHGFRVKQQIIPGAGHERRPYLTMNFFKERWRDPNPTIPSAHPSRRATAQPRTGSQPGINADDFNLRGPRPPALR
jgi:poly(3-hydroxybutyrate) depolymerase